MSEDNSQDQTPNRISLDKVLIEPELPQYLLVGPPVSQGTEADWVLERPSLFISARILPDDEAKKAHWTIYPNRGDDGFKENMDHEFTLIELLIENRSDKVFKTDQPREYLLRISLFNEPLQRIDSSNYSAYHMALEQLGKDNVLTKALDLDVNPLTIPPGKSFRWLNYFTKWEKTKVPEPEMIFKAYSGDWPMWPTKQRSPPPGLKSPVEGIVKFYLYRPDQNAQGYQEPEDVVVGRGVFLEGTNEWGETVRFFSDHPLEASASDDCGYVRIVSEQPGDAAIVGPGVINKYSRSGRELISVTNILPTWDFRTGPPRMAPIAGRLRRMWLAKNDIQRPLVAAEGELFAVAVEKHLWVFDARGELKHQFDTDWYPYSLCFGKGGKIICMGHDNTLVEFDLERNRSYDLQELPAQIDNLAQSHDGTIVAVGGEGVLMPIDPEGRVLKTFSVSAHERVFCASRADAILVWDGYGAIQVVDARGKEIVSNKSQPECCSGLAISPDGKLIAAGMHGSNLHLLEIENGLAIRSSFQTIGSPKAMAFHPTKPILFVGTDNSYLHVFHLENGPMFTKRLEGYVANDMAHGSSACILSMIDGYLHNLKLDDDKEV